MYTRPTMQFDLPDSKLKVTMHTWLSKGEQEKVGLLRMGGDVKYDQEKIDKIKKDGKIDIEMSKKDMYDADILKANFYLTKIESEDGSENLVENLGRYVYETLPSEDTEFIEKKIDEIEGNQEEKEKKTENSKLASPTSTQEEGKQSTKK